VNDDICTLHRGTKPLLVSLPHVGTHIPGELKPLFVERALALEDTDWHLEVVYDFARALGASVLVPRLSRYVVDLNRPPEDLPMYPGAHNTELVPTRFFTGEALYRDGCLPDETRIVMRREAYWRPYHDALSAELAILVAQHGHAVLWDGHSIRSELPWLFEGRLPDLNLGTAGGTSCAPALRARLSGILGAQRAFTQVVDGRFMGGYITRHYGRPARRIHAVQLEMCWRTYMAEAPPYEPDPARLAVVQPLLRALLESCIAWRPDD
jgi:N-formylglutamate deformylase